ncbi:hypothetical protein [Stygiolobus caldivivus]|uniref:Calcium binding protein SSO6904 domain-containing protein n=1 Tax=Stygiolobus caldivivus TaxID=2824673 RepID=A0A8D5U902_9CREN|nr:hypothetical protein [Stygiolobus caldivivus]BCU71152.1 hypothetical protein KN1_24490 [Stygiolobus caldivivus]
MSIMDEEEFKLIRQYRSKVDLSTVEAILEEIEQDYMHSGNLTSSIIFTYTNHMDAIKQNKEFYELLSKVLEKYSKRIGLENISQLVINSLK